VAAENAPLNLALARAMAEKRIGTRGKAAIQYETRALPNYLNRRGELTLVGPSGLFEESRCVRLDLKPDAGRALLLRVTW
jgi:hypothetical protein